MSRSDGPTLTTISWEDKGWLQHFPLNRDTVLDYFALSQFYDRTCNNEQLKMQRGAGAAAIAQLLEQMSGVEYVLHEAQELQPTSESSAHSLYVIRKQRREVARPPVITVLRMYYVLDGIVYEAPTLEAVLRTRLLKLGWLLGGAFSAIKDAIAGGTAAAEGSGSAEAAGSEAGGSGVSGAREAATAGGGAAPSLSEPDAHENADEPRAKRARSTLDS